MPGRAAVEDEPIAARARRGSHPHDGHGRASGDRPAASALPGSPRPTSRTPTTAGAPVGRNAIATTIDANRTRAPAAAERVAARRATDRTAPCRAPAPTPIGATARRRRGEADDRRAPAPRRGAAARRRRGRGRRGGRANAGGRATRATVGATTATTRETTSERGSTSRPRSTTRTAIRTSATRTRRSAPTRSPGIAACAATTCISSSGWTSTGRRSRRRPRNAGIAAAGSSSTTSRARFAGDVAHARHLATTSSSARPTRGHKRGVRALIERILEQQPRRLLREGVRGLVLRRLRAVQARERDRRRQVRAASDAHARVDRGAQLVLPARASTQDFLERAVRRSARSSCSPRAGATRCSRCSSRGSRTSRSRRSRLAWAIPFPHPLVDRRDAGDVGLVRRAAELPDGDRLSRRAGGESGGRRSCTSSARTSRACTRSSGRRCSQAAGLPLPERVWAHGFVLLGGERFSKSAGVRLDLDEAIDRFGPDAFRYFLLREVPFDADGSFSWERFEERYNADLANALGNLASRAISMVERYCDGVVPRRARGPTLDARDAADIGAVSRGDGRHARASCCTRRCRHVWQHGRARQRVRGPAGAVEAGEGSGAARRARERRSRRSCASSRATRCTCAVHAREGAELWRSSARPACSRISDSRMSRRSMRRGGASRRAIALSQRNRERRHVTAGTREVEVGTVEPERGTARRTTVPCSLSLFPVFLL